MPDNHLLFVDQTPGAAQSWAESIRSATWSLIRYILGAYPAEKQALNSIFSLKKLEQRYARYEIERACKMTLSKTQRPTVKLLQTLLKNNKKNNAQQEMKRRTENSENAYGFTRGASYYREKDNNEWTNAIWNETGWPSRILQGTINE